MPSAAQKVAVLSPDHSEKSRKFAEKLRVKLADKFRIVDDAMGEAAFASLKANDKFNLTMEESKTAGTAIGCDFFILVRSETLRRDSSKRGEHYESYAAIYAVSSRSGRLIYWGLPRFEATKADESDSLLSEAVGPLSKNLADKLRSTAKSEIAERPIPKMEEPPDPDSVQARSFRAPVPYRRLKPEYTADAFLYGIAATVDIMVDLEERGTILRTEIVRWAGYGLDESVEQAVRAMKWRPAERNGKPLPMRFLLRYNFKKIDKE